MQQQWSKKFRKFFDTARLFFGVSFPLQGGPLTLVNGVTTPNKQGYNPSYPLLRPFIGTITPSITGMGPPCTTLPHLFHEGTCALVVPQIGSMYGCLISFFNGKLVEQRKKNGITFHYTCCFIGIPVIGYNKPCNKG